MTRPVPLLLPPNQFDHFYRGGARIAALRGTDPGPTPYRRPEEWVASTTTRAGQATQGLSRLPDGTLLRDALAADPVGWLGSAHVERYGADGVELLVKLLDAGERLPVHLHPTRAFSRQHLGLAHGKTEAWVVLEADPGAVVGLGLRTPLTRDELADLVRSGQGGALVEALHTRPVRPGDGILVPAGTPHAIGAGVLVVEVQEPTDLSILLEWEGYAIDGQREGHLGLGWDLALAAVDLTVWSPSDVGRLVVSAPVAGADALVPALPPEAASYFRAHRVDAGAGLVDVPAGFAVLVVLGGAAELIPQDGRTLGLTRGDIALVPWAAGPWSLLGDATGVLTRPPAPDAPDAPW
ncbi:MAG TPA: class I mannose-6-phosphate isomerase [Kineosporiaceae bacterium]|nr:class I mannose-6-phosphate isomerase [Kineosporiaceae bacterium]